jgi:hypothetical protein
MSNMRSIYGFRVEVLHDHFQDDGLSVVFTYEKNAVVRFTAAVEDAPYTIRNGICDCGPLLVTDCSHIRSAHQALKALEQLGVSVNLIHDIRVMPFEGEDTDLIAESSDFR